VKVRILKKKKKERRMKRRREGKWYKLAPWVSSAVKGRNM
jgi:hypothetical protein